MIVLFIRDIINLILIIKFIELIYFLLLDLVTIVLLRNNVTFKRFLVLFSSYNFLYIIYFYILVVEKHLILYLGYLFLNIFTFLYIFMIYWYNSFYIFYGYAKLCKQNCMYSSLYDVWIKAIDWLMRVHHVIIATIEQRLFQLDLCENMPTIRTWMYRFLSLPPFQSPSLFLCLSLFASSLTQSP